MLGNIGGIKSVQTGIASFYSGSKSEKYVDISIAEINATKSFVFTNNIIGSENKATAITSASVVNDTTIRLYCAYSRNDGSLNGGLGIPWCVVEFY